MAKSGSQSSGADNSKTAAPPTPISSTNTIGPLTLKLSVPTTGNFGQSATLVVSLQNTTIGAFQFTPANNQWIVTNYQVGTTTVSFQANYSPAGSATLGNINISNGTQQVAGQSPQPFQGLAFSWDSSGNVVVPGSAS